MLRKLLVGLLGILPSLLLAAETEVLFNGRNLDGWTFDVIDPAVKPDSGRSSEDLKFFRQNHFGQNH